ncbi:MAG TPA: ATP synthase F0 subunit B [Terracidiphilus sp.]|nr:ATP synthase F0 subunit B [Terracidiphilus sp.]
MQEVVQQLGALLIGSIPTALLFLVLVVAYQFLVQKPLTATLNERRARTDGAVEEANRAIAQAEARAAEYAEKLRQARAEIYKAREERIRQWSMERDAALDSARKTANARVGQAKAELESEASRAKQAIQVSVAELANQVVRAVLPAATGGTR